MEIGFIGLGAMGSAIAANLARAGHAVHAWNRSGGDIEGVRLVDTAGEAFSSEVVFTMLSDDAAIREVVVDARLLEAARPGLVHVVMSTISIAFATELAQRHDRAGLGYVAAPVLGRPDVARQGQLNVLVAGKSEAIGKVRPLLDVVAKKAWPMGEEPHRANAAKIAANMMITMAIEAMAEAVVLTESNGLSRDVFFDLVLNTLFSGRSYESYSAHILKNEYEPGFTAKLGLKDLRLAGDAAVQSGRSLPMLDAVLGRMAEAVDAGLGEKDWSVMADVTINRPTGMSEPS